MQSVLMAALALVLAFGGAGCAGAPESDQDERPFGSPPRGDEALVYIYRAHTPDPPLQPEDAVVSVDRHEVGVLSNNRYTFVYLGTGPHAITVDLGPDTAQPRKVSLAMTFRPGRTYFIRFTRAATPSGELRVFLLSVSQAIGRREIEEWSSFLSPRTARFPSDGRPIPPPSFPQL